VVGKRSGFRRLERDAYNTPAGAAEPLLRHLSPATRFIEPCTGAGYLIEHLARAGHVLVAVHDLPDEKAIKALRKARDAAFFDLD
jgi:hypothetical protein